ncbi:hypothetical protein [Aliagarivorans taiwanensis]|uniref:hypothetical protein n=1 Tax=Aliagarivorans taiwanensis TaxID=561966 RepID=UPI00047E753C|nr:hypothetical protein [Aliagarivorans taiwanensis]
MVALVVNQVAKDALENGLTLGLRLNMIRDAEKRPLPLYLKEVDPQDPELYTGLGTTLYEQRPTAYPQRKVQILVPDQSGQLPIKEDGRLNEAYNRLSLPQYVFRSVSKNADKKAP